MEPVKIYLVDDDNIFVFLTMKTIESAGFNTKIYVFNNGKELVDHLNEFSDTPESLPDIILLDLSMPVMDGWEVLEEYKVLKPRLTKSIDLYILSSTISPYDIERAKSFSVVTDLLIKPFLKEQVIQLIEKVTPLTEAFHGK